LDERQGKKRTFGTIKRYFHTISKLNKSLNRDESEVNVYQMYSLHQILSRNNDFFSGSNILKNYHIANKRNSCTGRLHQTAYFSGRENIGENIGETISIQPSVSHRLSIQRCYATKRLSLLSTPIPFTYITTAAADVASYKKTSSSHCSNLEPHCNDANKYEIKKSSDSKI
jgi:hypothetical protein